MFRTRRRRRRRIGWVAVISVLIASPIPWILYPDAATTAFRPDANAPTGPPPAVAGVTPPTPTAAEQTPNLRAARAELARQDRVARETCDDLRVLVDREHALPARYTPDDLVSLRELGLPTLGQEVSLRREAAGNLARLLTAAQAAGEEDLAVASAHRSYQDQEASYARLVSVYGDEADKTSAPPGHSQHQLGTAVDLTNAAVGNAVHQDFGRTTAYRWLLDHAEDHGFVLAYPSGQERKTGYRWEPWHYRYIGVANAREMKNAHLGLQDFLTRKGVLPRC